MPPLTHPLSRRALALEVSPLAGREDERHTLLRRVLARLVVCVAVSALLTGCLSFHQGPMPGEPANATYVTLNDTRVRYADSGGSGTPVVLLHGFASAIEVWTGLDTALAAAGHRVIALDLKGFGWTDRPAGDYSPTAQADLVYALMDKLNVKRAALVGHSWGSSVALAMTLAHPERVERIVLYDAWVYEEQLPSGFIWARTPGLGEFLYALNYKERPDDKIEAAFYDKNMVSQALVDEVEIALNRPGTVAAALAAVRGQRYAEVEARYRTITQPVLLLWGADDVVARADTGYRLHRELPNADLIVYPECGHFPMIEARPASSRAMLDFINAPWGAPEGVAAKSPAKAVERGRDDLGSTPEAKPEATTDSDAAPADETPNTPTSDRGEVQQ